MWCWSENKRSLATSTIIILITFLNTNHFIEITDCLFSLIHRHITAAIIIWSLSSWHTSSLTHTLYGGLTVLTLDIVQFGSLLLQLRLQRLRFGFERRQSVARLLCHLLRGHCHKKTQVSRRWGVFCRGEESRDTKENLEMGDDDDDAAGVTLRGARARSRASAWTPRESLGCALYIISSWWWWWWWSIFAPSTSGRASQIPDWKIYFLWIHYFILTIAGFTYIFKNLNKLILQ